MELHQACEEFPGLIDDVLAAIRQAVILTDLDGRIVHASPMTDHILGFPPKELYQRNLDVLFTKEDLAYLYPNLLFLARNGQPFDGEIMLRRKNENRFFAFVVMRPVRSRTGVMALVAWCLDDIDKQKQFEKTLRETHFEDLIKIANGIAHELRNPLVSIGGFASRLYRSCQASQDQEQYYDYIVNNLRRIENLVKKVDYLVSLPKPHFRRGSIRAMIDRALEQFRPALEARRVDVEYQADDIQVAADPDLVTRAIAILVENAIEAVSPGGRLRIETLANDRHFEIRVVDDGPGIKSEDLPFIFNPFFSTKASGAGIDLAVVKRIMESHAGRAEVESSPGHGATFVLYFPYERRRAIRVTYLEEGQSTGMVLS